MASNRGQPGELHDETVINVAGLLKEPTGSTREYALSLARFPLGDDLVASDIHGEVRLTRLREAVIVRLAAAGTIELECARCLRPFPSPVAIEFSEEYRQTVDVRTGLGLAAHMDDDAETATISQSHELDLSDVLRQEILVELPMRPDCGSDCPGPEALFASVGAGEDAAGDERFALLAQLLGDDYR